VLFFSLLASEQVLAAPASTQSEEPLPAPLAFKLPMSNGYTMDVFGIPARGGLPASMLISISTAGRGVRYTAPATITETSMEADLGELGRISVAFQPANEPSTIRCNRRTAFRYESGVYEGTIEFHGEEGYTAVEATSVPVDLRAFWPEICAEPSFGGGGGRAHGGAELEVRNPALGPELFAVKHRRDEARLFMAMREYRAGISIERFATVRMSSDNFTYDLRLGTATLRPPAPFFGYARFDRRKKAGQRWSGNLSVDLPGKTDVPLTAPALRASLGPV
jgi:hypothetical protein